MSAASDPLAPVRVCSEHNQMFRSSVEAATILADVRDTIAKIVDHLDTHVAAEGHPLLVQRVHMMETTQAQQVATLAKIADTTAANCAALEAMRKTLENKAVERNLQWDWKTKLAVAMVALIGPLVTAGVALFAVLHENAAVAAMVSKK